MMTPGAVDEEMVQAAVMMTGKGGKVTITAVGHINERAVHVHAGMLIGYQRQIRGALFATATRCTTSRCCSACTSRASSSWTSWSPAVRA